MRAARRASLIVDRYLVESEVAIHVDPDAGPGARITAFVRGGERSPWLGWPAGGRACPWHSWHVPSTGACIPQPPNGGADRLGPVWPRPRLPGLMYPNPQNEPRPLSRTPHYGARPPATKRSPRGRWCRVCLPRLTRSLLDPPGSPTPR